MSIRIPAVVSIIVILAALAGCSAGNPLSTDFNGQTVNPVMGCIVGDSIFMRAKVSLDTDTMTASLTPYRGIEAVGDLVGDLEITSFLTFPFCKDDTCLHIKGVSIIAGTPPQIGLTVEVAHPFDLFDPLYDPSGTNRADLDLFDVRMYLVNDGGISPNPEKQTFFGFSTGTITFTPGFIANADGYDNAADAIRVTPPLDATKLKELTEYHYTGQTTMQPYKRIFEGPFSPWLFTPGGLPLDEDNRMSHGDWDEDTFIINLAPGAGTVNFDFAVAASYGVSARGKWNRVPEEVKYLASFRTQRPFIGLQDPPTSEGELSTNTYPTLNISVTHPWAGLSVAPSDNDYKNQSNNGQLLPPGAKSPLPTDLKIEGTTRGFVGYYWFDWSLNNVLTGGDGTDANPWRFSLPLEDPDNPGQAIIDGLYTFFVLVKADTGSSATYPTVGTDNYSLYYTTEVEIYSNP